jgi:hypothetical protein
MDYSLSDHLSGVKPGVVLVSEFATCGHVLNGWVASQSRGQPVSQSRG